MDTFAALADSDIAADHPISRSVVSRHLHVLVEAGLTEAESRGREPA